MKNKGLEIRFSTEDSFRNNLADVLSIHSLVDKVGVTSVSLGQQGVSFSLAFATTSEQQTVGVATAREVCDLVWVSLLAMTKNMLMTSRRSLRGAVQCEIECHFHNYTDCAIANAFSALEAGARMLTIDREYVKSKYDLTQLKHIRDLVISAVEVNVPFNDPVTSSCGRFMTLLSCVEYQLSEDTFAFTHKAGIHAKAILAKPATYEIANPADFNMQRYVHFASGSTGWNAIKSRSQCRDNFSWLCTRD